MRSLLKVLAVLLICLLAIGLYRGWFSVSSPKSDAPGDKVNVQMSVDKGKIKSDVKKAEETVKGEVKELEGKVKTKQDQK
jgi:plastocyanin domain-containing protein